MDWKCYLFAFVLIPIFSKLDGDNREMMTLLIIPKFSAMILLALGILVVTGPTLLWFIEDDVVALSQSPYGFS